MKIKITVTPEDIAISKAKGHTECNCCPIFKAVQRVPELHGYWVGSEYLYEDEDGRPNIKLPAQAKHFASRVFRGEWDLVKPLTFSVELPEEANP